MYCTYVRMYHTYTSTQTRTTTSGIVGAAVRRRQAGIIGASGVLRGKQKTTGETQYTTMQYSPYSSVQWKS